MRARNVLLPRAFLGVITVLLVQSVPAQAAAQGEMAQGEGACTPMGLPTDVRPDPGGPPTEVTVAVFMVDMTKVDDPSQSLTGDFLVIKSWTDPRLAEMAGCRFSLATVWHPRLDFLNSGSMQPRRTGLADQVEIGREAWSNTSNGISDPCLPIIPSGISPSTGRLS
jgi:hypothetical protein